MSKLSEQTQKLLERKKAESEMLKAIAENQRDAAQALLQQQRQGLSSETKPQAGAITADDNFGYMAELVAYHALGESALAVANVINKLNLGNQVSNISTAPGPKRNQEKPDQAAGVVLMVDSLDFSGGAAQHLQVESQLRFFHNEFSNQIKANKDLLKTDKVTNDRYKKIAATTAVLALATLADIVGFFRVDYDIKGRKITPSEEAIRLKMAGAITEHRVLFQNFHGIQSSKIINDFSKLIEDKTTLKSQLSQLMEQNLAPIELAIEKHDLLIAALQEKIMDLNETTDQDQIAVHKKRIEDLELNIKTLRSAMKPVQTAIANTDAIIAGFNAFNESITSVAEKQKHSMLGEAIFRQYLLDQKVTHLLYAAAPSAGGESILKKSFWGSGETGFLGGGVLSYILVDLQGQVVSADTINNINSIKYNLEDLPPQFKSRKEIN